MAITMSKRLYQRQIPTFLVATTAVIMVIEYFITPIESLTAVSKTLVRWGSILTSFIILYGYVCLFMLKGRGSMRVEQRDARWFGSVAFMVGLVTFAILALSTPELIKGTTYVKVFDATIGIIGIGIGATQAQYVSFAYYRLCRRITTLAAFMFFLGFVFMTAQSTTFLVYLWPPFYDIEYWIMEVPAMIAMRAATIATGFGVLILMVRALIGREPGMVELEVV